ncbi:homeobox-domain-containing protein [Amylocystis lapponica]|nr:homeobox-domain-containing protein [Amylocystis lapponica]
MDHPKKPRHRHSAFQLAALNELYDQNEHPSLEDRTSLAERLGMETKTVNSWFQNKRASSKKRHRGPPPPPQCELPPIAALIASVSAPLPPSDFDDLSEDDHYAQKPHSALSEQNQQQTFYAARSRPLPVQTDELRKAYDANQHPSKEEREELGQRIGMRYQSVTNWFQNQRSIAKKRKEEEDAQAASSSSSKSRTYSPFPPAAGAAHPSLAVPPASVHPSLAGLTQAARKRRSTSVARGAAASGSRPVSRRASPYRTHAADRALAATHSRPRRTRPEPHQLEALKKLFQRTATPSIEERGALAIAIGMDVGKVTNWFRNLRQTTRKRGQRAGEMDEDEDAFGEDADNASLATYGHSRSVSRAGTPGASVSGGSSGQFEDMWIVERAREHFGAFAGKGEEYMMYAGHSDVGSEEDVQEAVTPSPESSPAPAVTARQPPPLGVRIDSASYAELEKATAKFHRVDVEDALLLLGFHHHVVR